MSLWARVQHLPPEVLQDVCSMYGERFPIEVRHFLAPWIEEKIRTNVEIDHPQYEQYTVNLLKSLIQELQSKAASLDTEDLFLTRLKLMDVADNFRHLYGRNPSILFEVIRQCLITEMNMVARAENLGGPPTNMPGDRIGTIVNHAVTEIAQQVDTLRRRTQETGEALRKMEQKQEAFAINYHDLAKLNAHLQHLATQQQSPQNEELENKIRKRKEEQEQLLNHQITELMQWHMTWSDKLKNTITGLATLHSRVLDDELATWKRRQQLAGNGTPFKNNLDTIQEWCENLAELIWLNRQQISEADRLKRKLQLELPGVHDILPTLHQQITDLLISLVASTFVIEKQPPQVMKTNTRFASTVRLLVGGKLNVHMSPPQVYVSIINEVQANALLKNNKVTKSTSISGEILNNTGTMECRQVPGQLIPSLFINFRNMQLKKIRRAGKKWTDSVTDEKFCLLFQSEFNIGGRELSFRVWTLSLPVVVIVHGNQEPHAWATITWYNAFAGISGALITVPEKVSWDQVAKALNVKFKSATGRALTEDHLHLLAEKAFHGENGCCQDYTGLFLNWSQLSKDLLPGRSFTFWEWFYAIMKLTREHFKGLWMDGCIMGFVRKRQAEEMLVSCASGTFLMRFSDSALGGLTIAWVGAKSEIFMLQPFTSKDLAIRSLADRILDLQHLLYLYPCLPKDQAFSKYYTPFTENQQISKNGYLKPLLVTHVPGWGGPVISGEIPSHSLTVGVNISDQIGSYTASPPTLSQTPSPESIVLSAAELPAIDDPLNLDQLNGSSLDQLNGTEFSEFM